MNALALTRSRINLFSKFTFGAFCLLLVGIGTSFASSRRPS